MADVQLAQWEKELIRMLDNIIGINSSDKNDSRRFDENSEVFFSPEYYQSDDGFDAIDVIEAFDLNFNLGNVIKYVLRAGKKNESVESDLKKAIWYLKREINAQKKDC